MAEGNEWTRPVTSEQIANARRGDWSVLLTPSKPVPREWFGEISGKRLLALASGGGQQAPLFAAAGAEVTSLDASEAQLGQDELVAKRDGLTLRTLRGDMRDLGILPANSFDLVFNPCSVCFVDNVEAVWQSVARVLKPGGFLLTGFINPWYYLLNEAAFDRGELVITNQLPYRDVSRDPHPDAAKELIEFSHTLDLLIGGQLRAGLMLTDMFEDEWSAWAPLLGVAKPFIATRAVKRL